MKKYGDCYLFEHGGYRGSPISCGVDQAHLHIVPLPFNLLAETRKTSKEAWQSANKIQLPYEFAGDREYWYASSKNGSIYCDVSSPESQWFRKLIASQVGCPKMWDYKKFEFLENIHETMTAMEFHG